MLTIEIGKQIKKRQMTKTPERIAAFKQLDIDFIKGILLERLIVLKQVGSPNTWELNKLSEQVKQLELWKQEKVS